ncbi:hypothetical protein GEMRC1_009009 [Eukaryota sp. GEM-RC1]
MVDASASLNSLASSTDDDLIRAFNLFDKDGDGSISLDEVYEVVKTLNLDLSKEQVTNMFHPIDKDNNFQVDFEEFRSLLMSTQHQLASQSQIIEAFRVFDVGNGTVAVDGILPLLQDLGDRFTAEEALEFVESLKKFTHNGFLDYWKFVEEMNDY